jgi:hypothetical protein
LASFGFGMLSANIGLFNAIGSYNQVLTIGATTDPTQMPDVWFYADCLNESFAELRDAAEGAAEEAGVPSPTATAAQVAASVAKRANGRRKRPAKAAVRSR